MFNLKQYVIDLDVRNDGSVRTNCPVCKGYKTFTVTNNMGVLLWNCYKVTCDVGGRSKVRLTIEDIKNKHKLDIDKENFSLPEYIVPHRDRWETTTFCTKWNIDADAVNLHYDVKEKRVVFPVENNGTILDAVGRAVTSRLPKWKRYGKNDLPYTFGCGSVAVVVEDCVSASVVGSEVYVGVAVLGTSLSEAHKKYLSRFSTAIIALDPDALPKTLAFAKELRGYVKDVRVLKLKDDLKYYNEEDITNLINITPKEISTWN
jgi:hypothetical protein|tara:strand:+ start:1059 stop:1841 length:783 start_codon:yes stop_codon:yes gene_type:complete